MLSGQIALKTLGSTQSIKSVVSKTNFKNINFYIDANV